MSPQTASLGAELVERLRFDTMTAELSLKFSNLPASEMDREIWDAERSICKFLGSDVAGRAPYSHTPKHSECDSNAKTMRATKSNLLPAKLTLCWLGWTTSMLLVFAFAHADVLELKNGQVLTGKYAGGTAGTIRFETTAGTQVIETSQALALTFTTAAAQPSAPLAAPPAAAPTPPATPAPAAAPGSVAVPAGTTLLVRMVDGASSNDSTGKRFTTTLETDLVVNGMMAAKAGTKVYGRVAAAQKAGRYAGQSKLDLRLSEIAAGPSLAPLVTSGYAQAGDKSIKKTARGAAAGAAIGAIADDGEGAAKGAAIGAVASGVKRGQPITVPPGTLLEFTLQQPLTLKLTQ